MCQSTEARDGLREILATKQWFGFDLDDTLHDFRRASRAATMHCLTHIAENYNQVTLNDLEAQYREVLRQGTRNAFVDGKTSHDYRRQRFIATLNHFSLSHDLVEHLLEEYDRILVENLALKPGALALFQAIKASSRKIVVITEGPQDAQERAIRDLGLAEYVDFLATTNRFGVEKTSGLFAEVLGHLRIRPDELVYVGDNLARDIVPTRAEGIFAIHFDEGQDIGMLSDPPSINSLIVLNGLISVSEVLGLGPTGEADLRPK